MRKKNKSFESNSKNVLWALLVVAAAVTVYGFSQAAVVSHSPSEIIPQGAGSSLDSDYLQGLTSADLLAAAGGGSAVACTVICNGNCPSPPTGWTLRTSSGSSGGGYIYGSSGAAAGRCTLKDVYNFYGYETMCCYFKD